MAEPDPNITFWDSKTKKLTLHHMPQEETYTEYTEKKKMLFGDLTVHIGLSMIIVSPVKVFLVILCNSVLNGMVHFGI